MKLANAVKTLERNGWTVKTTGTMFDATKAGSKGIVSFHSDIDVDRVVTMLRVRHVDTGRAVWGTLAMCLRIAEVWSKQHTSS